VELGRVGIASESFGILKKAKYESLKDLKKKKSVDSFNA
jgi:hypothetical protein